MEEIFKAVNSLGQEIGCYLFWTLIATLWLVGRTGEIIRLLKKLAGETEPEEEQ